MRLAHAVLFVLFAVAAFFIGVTGHQFMLMDIPLTSSPMSILTAVTCNLALTRLVYACEISSLAAVIYLLHLLLCKGTGNFAEIAQYFKSQHFTDLFIRNFNLLRNGLTPNSLGSILVQLGYDFLTFQMRERFNQFDRMNNRTVALAFRHNTVGGPLFLAFIGAVMLYFCPDPFGERRPRVQFFLTLACCVIQLIGMSTTAICVSLAWSRGMRPALLIRAILLSLTSVCEALVCAYLARRMYLLDIAPAKIISEIGLESVFLLGGIIVPFIQYYQWYRVDSISDNLPRASSRQCQDPCAICMMDCDPNAEGPDAPRVLPCSHVVHAQCLREWGQHQTVCPVCSADINDIAALEAQQLSQTNSSFPLPIQEEVTIPLPVRLRDGRSVWFIPVVMPVELDENAHIVGSVNIKDISHAYRDAGSAAGKVARRIVKEIALQGKDIHAFATGEETLSDA